MLRRSLRMSFCLSIKEFRQLGSQLEKESMIIQKHKIFSEACNKETLRFSGIKNIFLLMAGSNSAGEQSLAHVMMNNAKITQAFKDMKTKFDSERRSDQPLKVMKLADLINIWREIATITLTGSGLKKIAALESRLSKYDLSEDDLALINKLMLVRF